ncbi:RNA polymerase sigma factor [Bradyrhizobium diazoefficiens]|jgi:RNA polymerase sigma-70 factor (ECF subfamily)|uniref:RNA polymerase sigma factor n=1 Tax=Bradyrhizobium diazoefficiens TaxID=1355477 RepID=UPI00272CCDA1|nr:RNA polymerase subunit sigma-70 [Bradyrhizobium diazoefficiens]WLA68949.1 RNA polymerase subunit sigma-70 [Bradyrhizobium diazoefficiens]
MKSPNENLPMLTAGSLEVQEAVVRAALVGSYDRLRNYLQRRFGGKAEAEEVLQAFRTREMPFPHELNDRLAADQDSAANAAVCECLHTHLSLLKPEHAEVIRRVDLAGEPRELVAADLGVTVNNLTVRLHRARHALKVRLEQTCVVCLEESFWECRCADNRGPT